jgi:hypothetical protein
MQLEFPPYPTRQQSTQQKLSQLDEWLMPYTETKLKLSIVYISDHIEIIIQRMLHLLWLGQNTVAVTAKNKADVKTY